MNLVSIVMPVRNSERYLADAIESVQEQTYKNWELLIEIDPSSDDESLYIAKTYARADARVKWKMSRESGVVAVRNAAIQRASGRFVAFLDSDDIWKPEKLNKQIEFMLKVDAGFSCTAFRRTNEAADRVGRWIKVPNLITYTRLMQGNCILCSSAIIDRDQVSGLEFPNLGCEDYALWLRVLRSGFKCYGLNEDLVHYRIVKGSRGSSKWRTFQESWRIHRHQERRNLVNAGLGMVPFLLRNLEKHLRF